MPVVITNEGVTASIPHTNDDAAWAIIHRHQVSAGRCGYSWCPYYTIYRDDDDCTSIYWSWRVRCSTHATIDWWRFESNEAVGWKPNQTTWHDGCHQAKAQERDWYEYQKR